VRDENGVVKDQDKVNVVLGGMEKTSREFSIRYRHEEDSSVYLYCKLDEDTAIHSIYYNNEICD
jgi:hypothetical protein